MLYVYRVNYTYIDIEMWLQTFVLKLLLGFDRMTPIHPCAKYWNTSVKRPRMCLMYEIKFYSLHIITNY